MGCKHVIELKKMLPPTSKESAGIMNEVENANFLFKDKSYVDALLQKLRGEERDTKSLRSNNLTQKG